MKKFKVLIVDDSALIRRILKDIINSDEEFTVVDEAKDGLQAIDKIKEVDPDIMTLDIEMPKVNGLIALQHILKIKNIPILIVSSYTKTGSKIALKALELGAIDVVEKPSSLDYKDKKNEILIKLRAGLNANLKEVRHSLLEIEKSKKFIKITRIEATKLVAIASSTGGPKSLMDIIPKINGNIDGAIAIVQHMPAGFTRSFAERLDSLSQLNVFESYDNCKLMNGDCVIAQGGKHMVFDEKGYIIHTDDPPYHSVKPSADIMMISAVKHFKNKIIGVVLTGMGKDGSEGVSIIKKMNGRNIAESQESALIYGMPKAAKETGAVDFVLDRKNIAEKIEELLNEI
ncbi:MAG: chemotaxis response regulator protein-glutamate methylesterase [bacterium]|nr:chemotaxis response regulator protein-glutamate methylesterase [bacterium]